MSTSLDDTLKDAFASIEVPDALVSEAIARAESQHRAVPAGNADFRPVLAGARVPAQADDRASGAERSGSHERKGVEKKRVRPVRRVRAFRVAAALAACVACAAVGVGGYAWASVDAVVQVNVNPSIELSLNRFDIVVGARGLNEEGTQLLASCNVRGKSYEEALKVLFESDALASFVGEASEAETLDVAVSVACENVQRCASLEARTEESVDASSCGGRQLRYRNGYMHQGVQQSGEDVSDGESEAREDAQECPQDNVSPGHKGNGQGEMHRGEGARHKNFKNSGNNA